MATSQQHLDELLKTLPQERARAARVLIESLDDEPEDPDAARAWADEITRRARGILDGSRPTLDGADVHARVLERLRSLDK